MASATAIVRRADRNLISENGGPLSITFNWVKSLLYRMGFVKRRGSTAMKMIVNNFESIKEQFVLHKVLPHCRLIISDGSRIKMERNCGDVGD